MSCETFEAFIIDEALAKPSGFDAHLASCSSCRALKASHLDALQLGRGTPRLGRRLPLERVQRRAGIVFGLTLALLGGGGLYALRASSAPARAGDAPVIVTSPAPSLEGETPVASVAAEAEGEREWAALIALNESVALESSRNPRVDDAAYRVFGQLPLWVAPTTTRPIRSLGRAASPIVYTSED